MKILKYEFFEVWRKICGKCGYVNKKKSLYLVYNVLLVVIFVLNKSNFKNVYDFKIFI